MHRNKQGFTLLELVIVIFLLAALVSLLVIPGRLLIMKATAKSRAAVDAANLRTVRMQIEEALIWDKGMDEITRSLSPIQSQFAPGAEILVNYSKNVTLEIYFADENNYYSMDYLTQVAVEGHSALSVKKPFTLGFWFKLGEGKINEYIPRK